MSNILDIQAALRTILEAPRKGTLADRAAAVRSADISADDSNWAPRVRDFLLAGQAEKDAEAMLTQHPAWEVWRAATAERERLRDLLKNELICRGGEGAAIATDEGVVSLKVVEVPAHRRHTVVVGPGVRVAGKIGTGSGKGKGAGEMGAKKRRAG